MAAFMKVAKSFFSKQPLVANTLIYGGLYVGAELSQQTITKKFMTSEPQDIDKAALGRFALMGTCVYSPTLYHWYKWLDKSFPGTSSRTIVKKLLLDQFIITPPLLVIFFTGMALMEGAEDTFKELREKFGPTFMRACLFWPPVQIINFMLVPPKYRLVYMGCMAFAWVNILCWVKRQQLGHTVAEV